MQILIADDLGQKYFNLKQTNSMNSFSVQMGNYMKPMNRL